MLRKKVVQRGEAWSDLKFWVELAKKLRYEEQFPSFWNNWDNDPLPIYREPPESPVSSPEKKPEPFAEMHIATAGEYGLTDGNIAIVETARGSIRIKATDKILQGVVSIPHGWFEANVNLLATEEPADPVLGYPAPKALLCRIRAAG